LAQFVGTFSHRVNSKGQVAFPAKMRETVQPDEEGKRSVFLLKTSEPCLFALRSDELQELSARLKQSGMFARDRRLREAFFSSIEPVDIDPQGRILLPQSLREEAGLGKDVVFVGAGNAVEIWDESAWSSRAKEVEAARRDAAGEVSAMLEEV
jgi:MraZ protein